MSEGFCVPGMSKAQILQKAREMRGAFEIKDALYVHVAAIMEILAYDLGFFELDIVEDRELKNMYAYYNPKTNKMSIRESVYEKACNGDGRQRFTLAHELAHWYLHRNNIVLSRVESNTPKYCDSEWQANTFASMLLIEPALIENMTPEQISEKCGVSYQAATIAKNKRLK